MTYMNVKMAAKQWKLNERRVTFLCRTGKVYSAIKENGIWLIPENAKKPEDSRKNKDKALKK